MTLFGDMYRDFPENRTDDLRVIGIDLGTTNSTVCEIVWLKGESKPSPPRCLNVEQPTPDGRYTHVLVPSVVALYREKVWVGEGAKRLRGELSAGMGEYKSWFAETKNDMGIRRTYHRAPTGYRSARAIAARILEFLYGAAKNENDIPISRVVVTVPASFQTAQRQDTVSAAQQANIRLSDGDLLDEPIAAFLAYLAESGSPVEDLRPDPGRTKNLLVFDYGGGTCDVAVFRIGRRRDGELTATPITVSRYHRLGGGDIDRAIIHEVLIPQLLEQNGIDPFSLEFEDKRHRIQPALLAVAEALKQKLCIEIVRLRKLGRWDKIDKAGVVQKLPGAYKVELKDRSLVLDSPTLSAEAFERLLAPFLDRDLLFPREDEYRITCSIFAPIEDALLRGGVERSEIDLCLLVGGSSLIPHVADAVAAYFENARLLMFPSRDDTQTAVARGAAIHALHLAVCGAPLVRQVCHDDIYLQTRLGPIHLIPAGAELPYPPNCVYNRNEELAAPETVKARSKGNIRIQVIAGKERRPLFETIWEIEGPVTEGDPLWLDYRFDENQVLTLRLGKCGDEKAFEAQVENPLTHVVNPNATKAEIERLEEELRTRKIPQHELQAKFEDLGDLYRKIRQYEKALGYYKRALQLSGQPSAYLLNRMAFCARDRGDRRRAEEFFAQAARYDPWPGTFFNWALEKEKWGQPAEALDLVEKALTIERDPPYLVLKAQLLQRLGDVCGGRLLAGEALKQFPPIETQDLYHLSWLRTAARIVGDTALEREADSWLQRRSDARARFSAGIDSELPDLRRQHQEDV